MNKCIFDFVVSYVLTTVLTLAADAGGDVLRREQLPGVELPR